MSAFSRDEILAELGRIKSHLDQAKDRAEDLYEARLALYQAGQALDPPLTQREMADVAGVSEVAVTAQLRKGRRAG